MNEVKLFESEEFGLVRTVVIDGEPWFVGRDVAKSLGYAKPQNAIRDNVDEDDARIWGVTDSLNREQQTLVINESGMYSLILRSQLESAKRFKKWVTSEVLPSIRQNGGYISGQETMTDDELMETYTAEQLAEMVIEKEKKISDSNRNFYDVSMQLKEVMDANLCNINRFETQVDEFQEREEKLQSEVEKYRKAFEDAKNERDCQIAEYQEKIEELNAENSELHCELQAVNAFQEGYPTEPIKVADMLINATCTREKGDIEKAFYKAFGNNSDMVEENVFDISELRQIAEHLLVYCNNQKDDVNE